MKAKEKLLIYPYNIEFAPVLRHSEIIKNYSISHLISPEGFGFSGKDASVADKGNEIGIIVSSDFEKALDDVDAVLIADYNIELDFERIILNKICIAAEKKKNIICFKQFIDTQRCKIEALCSSNGVELKFYNNLTSINAPLYGESERILSVDVPVIFILGMSERNHKFEIQLSIREKLIGMGYKVSHIGSRHYCDFFGFHPFPSFMFSNSISEEDKVVLFNRVVKSIEYVEKPDLIIIGIPGGFMPFNKTFSNRFGILAFEVSNAIRPDVAIVSTFYEEYLPEYFKTISTSLRYKLGFPADCFNLSNLRFDWRKADEEKKYSYLSLDTNFIDENTKKFVELETPLYNVFNKSDVDNMVRFLLRKLEGYGEVEAV